MNKVFRLFAVLSMVMVCPLAVFSQSGDNSPFSRFGIGDITDPSFMAIRGMASLGTVYIDPYNLNIKNPASYSLLKSTAFDIGIYARYTNLSDNENQINLWSGNLEYISLGFPLRNPINEVLDRIEKDYALGMNFTLMPYSQVGYNITSLEVDPNFGSFQRNYKGNGGSYKLMWGNSFTYKQFSVGLNIGYLFGNIHYEQNIYFDDLSFAYQNRYENSYGINGFVWNAGAFYRLVLNKSVIKKDNNIASKILTFGLQGNLDMGFNTNGRQVKRGIFVEAPLSDTILFADELIGRGILPAEFSVGSMYYHGESWALGMDFNYYFWSHYSNEARPEKLSDAYRIALGGYFVPNPKAFNQYYKRVKYRFGLYYHKDPREINDEQFNGYGVNIGAGFPLIFQRNYYANMNPYVQFGRRGSKTLLSESFIKIGFGFTFNDNEWFLKRKYN